MILLLLACRPVDTGSCAEASERYGATVCVEVVPDEPTWEEISVPALAVDQDRVTKYLVPATEDAPLPPLFVDAGTFPLHYDFFVKGYPEHYADLTFEEYAAMVTRPEVREYWSGELTEYKDGTWGFVTWDDRTDDSTTVTCEQVAGVLAELQPRFELGDLVFTPNSDNQRAAVESWDCGVPLRIRDDVDYEAYTTGEAYGTVKRIALEDLEEASVNADFGYQDLLVIDEAPFDLERVVSGIVTGSRQGALSHLNVRSSARGTPNVYVADPFTAFEEWEGVLVHATFGPGAYVIEAADPEEAQDWWEDLRPEPLDVPAPDLDTTAMPGLLELPVGTAEERAAGVAAYGAKGRNLAILYQGIAPDLQLQGLLVPMSAYQAFIEHNSWEVDLGDGPAAHSFAETLAAWHADPAFLGDAALRRARLVALGEAMRAAPVDPALVAALSARIEETFGDRTTMVRFRSSSNAEDAPGFTGAGLYSSESACVADSEDADAEGPSLCDPDKGRERSIEDALRAVWSSLWAVGAWEERDWYGIDHRLCAMGVLVNTQSEDEAANMVAFSANPLASDARMLVETQVGDLDVVSAEPGVYPERVFLTVQGGEVVDIDRQSHSSESSAWILDDATLERLGALLDEVAGWFPLDHELPEGHTLLWDTEWKVLADGRLVIKQIRPYMRED